MSLDVEAGVEASGAGAEGGGVAGMPVSDAGAAGAGVVKGDGVPDGVKDEGSAPMYLEGEMAEVVGGGLAGAALVPELSGVGADGAGNVAGVAGGETAGGAVPELSEGEEFVVGAGFDVEEAGGVPAEASGVGAGMTLVCTSVGSVKRISQATTFGFSGAIS